MAAPQSFSGTGTVYRASGQPLDGQRRYSFTLLPYDVPAFTNVLDRRSATRPGCMGCWVELRGQEPLELEGEQLRLRLGDGRSIPFHLFEVSAPPPHLHTIVVDAWPEVAAEVADATAAVRLRHRA